MKNRNKAIIIVCIALIVLGGAVVSTYLIVRGHRANDVCIAVQKTHDVFENVLNTSKAVSLQSLEDNPQPGVTAEVINKYYDELFKQLEPLDISC